jgi:hypothetical protein
MKSLRDVCVNIMANMFAAAIIYLLGVCAGLFAARRELVVASATVLMVGAMMTGLVAMVAERWRSRDEVSRPVN